MRVLPVRKEEEILIAIRMVSRNAFCPFTVVFFYNTNWNQVPVLSKVYTYTCIYKRILIFVYIGVYHTSFYFG
jgi:hypothetical protein